MMNETEAKFTSIERLREYEKVSMMTLNYNSKNERAQILGIKYGFDFKA